AASTFPSPSSTASATASYRPARRPCSTPAGADRGGSSSSPRWAMPSIGPPCRPSPSRSNGLSPSRPSRSDWRPLPAVAVEEQAVGVDAPATAARRRSVAGQPLEQYGGQDG